MVLYIDRPSTAQPVAVWGLDVNAPAPVPTLYSGSLDVLEAHRGYRVSPWGMQQALIERQSDGQQWLLNTNGNRPSLSPDGRFAAWTDSPGSAPYDERKATTYAAVLQDGGGVQAGAVLAEWGGGLVSWLPDSVHLLVVGRPDYAAPEWELAILSLADGRRTPLLRDTRLAAISLSPDGRWVLCTVFFSQDPERDGVWLLATSGEEPRKMRFYGAYAWRDARRLVYVPLRDNPADSHVFRQYDVLTRENVALTSPDTAFFSLSGDDWSISPDGRYIAYVDSRDKAIWVAEIGD